MYSILHLILTLSIFITNIYCAYDNSKGIPELIAFFYIRKYIDEYNRLPGVTKIDLEVLPKIGDIGEALEDFPVKFDRKGYISGKFPFIANDSGKLTRINKAENTIEELKKIFEVIDNADLGSIHPPSKKLKDDFFNGKKMFGAKFEYVNVGDKGYYALIDALKSRPELGDVKAINNWVDTAIMTRTEGIAKRSRAVEIFKSIIDSQGNIIAAKYNALVEDDIKLLKYFKINGNNNRYSRGFLKQSLVNIAGHLKPRNKLLNIFKSPETILGEYRWTELDKIRPFSQDEILAEAARCG